MLSNRLTLCRPLHLSNTSSVLGTMLYTDVLRTSPGLNVTVLDESGTVYMLHVVSFIPVKLFKP